MFRKINKFVNSRSESIDEEINTRSTIGKIISDIINKEILKKNNNDFKISYTINKGLIRIETDSKLIDQEIVLRINIIEKKLKNEGVVFRKVVI